MSQSKAGLALGVMGLVWVFVVILANVAMWWAIASAITSGIKVANDNCGSEYQIESVVNGNWFCE